MFSNVYLYHFLTGLEELLKKQILKAFLFISQWPLEFQNDVKKSY